MPLSDPEYAFVTDNSKSMGQSVLCSLLVNVFVECSVIIAAIFLSDSLSMIEERGSTILDSC